MTQVSKMVLDKGCGLRLWGPHLLTHLGVKPNADKNSRKAKWVPTESEGGWSKDGPVPIHHAWSRLPWNTGRNSRCPTTLASFASCQSSQAKPRPRYSGDLRVVSQGTLTPSNLKRPQRPSVHRPSQHPRAEEALSRAAPWFG